MTPTTPATPPADPALLRARRVEARSLHLALAARREALAVASAALAEFLDGFDLSPTLTYTADLVAEEILMNIVWHAGQAGAAEMTLDAQVADDAVVLTFGDPGPAFDPTQVAAKALPRRLDDAEPGGLGLVLVRQFTSRLAYERRDGRNLLHASFARRDEAQG